jgi:hypothetical protein
MPSGGRNNFFVNPLAHARFHNGGGIDPAQGFSPAKKSRTEASRGLEAHPLGCLLIFAGFEDLRIALKFAVVAIVNIDFSSQFLDQGQPGIGVDQDA